MRVNALAKQVLGRICRQTGATLLVTAHPSKASMESGTYYSGTTAWNGAFRSRMVLKADGDDPTKRTLELAKSNYSAADPIDLYMHGGLLLTYSTLGTSHGQRELEAVRNLVFELLDRDIRVVRGNGSGLKPRDLVLMLLERGVRLHPRKILEYLNALEIRGVLKYQRADRNDRNSRAGFARGLLANGP